MNPDPFFEQLSFYKHYMDDCFLIFENASLNASFLNWINSIHPTIKSVGHYDRCSLIFWKWWYTEMDLIDYL